MSKGDQRYVRRTAGRLAWSGPKGSQRGHLRYSPSLASVTFVTGPTTSSPTGWRLPAGELISLPTTFELDDVYMLRERGVSVQSWRLMAIEAFERLYQDGKTTGRLFVLNLHPYLIGQPFRIKYLDEVVRHAVSRAGVWKATGRDIVDWYLANAN